MPIFRIQPDRNRPTGWQILSLADVPFYVEPSFLVFIGIIMLMELQQWRTGPSLPWQAFSRVGLLGLTIFFSLLAHEAGHALTARLMGYRNISVSLVMFGGVTRHPPTARGQSLVITLAGPLMTILLAAGGWGLLHAPAAADLMQHTVIRYLAETVWYLNTAWAVFNLLPIFPMDGGQAVNCLLAFIMRDTRAMLSTAFISLAVCAGIGSYLLIGANHAPNNFFFIIFLLLIQFISMNVQIIRDLWRHR